MRLYQYLPTEFALQNLRHRRLKISLLDQLNDPFELVAAARPDKSQRVVWENWRKSQIDRWGLICFSRTWKNPVMWSHYADKHKGMCLGFDVPDEIVFNVRYTKNRLKMDIVKLHEEGKLNEQHMLSIFKTKFIDWKYEKETRLYSNLNEKDESTGLYFYSFDDQLILREVLAGPLSEVSEDDIRDAVCIEDSNAKIKKTRLAFKTFDVVLQQKGFE